MQCNIQVGHIEIKKIALLFTMQIKVTSLRRTPSNHQIEANETFGSSGVYDIAGSTFKCTQFTYSSLKYPEAWLIVHFGLRTIL